MIASTSSPFLQPGGYGGKTENPNPPITWLLSLATKSSPLDAFQSYLININSGVVKGSLCISRHLYHFYHLGSSKGLGSLQGMGMKNNVYILL